MHLTPIIIPIILILFPFFFTQSCKVCGFINPHSLFFPKPPRSSVINFRIDDVFTHLLIDDVYYPDTMTQFEKDGWNVTHSITLDLYPGNKISIAGFNIGSIAGMLGTVNYYNQQGALKQYHTGLNWVCDDKPAYGVALNNGSLCLQDDNYPSEAYWIWSSLNSPLEVDVTCSFTIPLNA